MKERIRSSKRGRMPISKGTRVAILFRATDETGRLIDETAYDEFLDYEHGKGQLLPALEKVLEGKRAGDRVEVTLGPGQAYGHVGEKSQKERQYSLTKATVVGPLLVGSEVRVKDDRGKEGKLLVTKVEGPKVTLAQRHPLAGKTLTFEIKVRHVRKADSR